MELGFNKLTAFGLFLLISFACKAQVVDDVESQFLTENNGKTLAFPGAEGNGWISGIM